MTRAWSEVTAIVFPDEKSVMVYVAMLRSSAEAKRKQEEEAAEQRKLDGLEREKENESLRLQMERLNLERSSPLTT